MGIIRNSGRQPPRSGGARPGDGHARMGGRHRQRFGLRGKSVNVKVATITVTSGPLRPSRCRPRGQPHQSVATICVGTACNVLSASLLNAATQGSTTVCRIRPAPPRLPRSTRSACFMWRPGDRRRHRQQVHSRLGGHVGVGDVDDAKVAGATVDGQPRAEHDDSTSPTPTCPPSRLCTCWR